MRTNGEPTRHTKHDLPVRVALVQPALPRYRLPVFIALSGREAIELAVWYETVPGLPNVEPVALNAIPTRVFRANTPLGPFLWSFAQWRLASPKRCDVLVLTWNTRYVSLIPSLLKARLQGLPVILWGHGRTTGAAKTRNWLRHAVARLAAAVVFYDFYTAEEFADSHVSSTAVFVAQNAVDQAPIIQAREAWISDTDRRASFRRRHGLETAQLVVFVARLEARKRPDLLLDAAALLATQFPNLQIVFVGSGRKEERTLKNKADDLGIADRVSFLGPKYDEEELAPWLVEATAMAFPGTIGLSVLTAFGFGLPVVANDQAQANHPEWHAIIPGTNGLLFEEGSATSLAQALRCLFDDPDMRESLSEGAIRTARDDYTLERMVDGLESAIRHCARTSRVEC